MNDAHGSMCDLSAMNDAHGSGFKLHGRGLHGNGMTSDGNGRLHGLHGVDGLGHHVVMGGVLDRGDHVLSLDGVHVHVVDGLDGALDLDGCGHGHGVRLSHGHGVGHVHRGGHVRLLELGGGLLNDNTGVVGSVHVVGRLALHSDFRVGDGDLSGRNMVLGHEHLGGLDGRSVQFGLVDGRLAASDHVLDAVVHTLLHGHMDGLVLHVHVHLFRGQGHGLL